MTSHRGERPPGRRPWAAPAALGSLLAVALAAVHPVALAARTGAGDPPSLHAQAVAVTASGHRVPVGAADLDAVVADEVDGTRALDAVAAARQRAWLAAGTVPGAGGRWADLTRDALLDLHVLTLEAPGGTLAAVAGWSPHWRYVWPRDAAFVAVALARTGHQADAEAVLAYLQRVRPAGSVGFQARYLPDGSGRVPDARGSEADGAGWQLWAVAELAALTPVEQRPALLRRLAPLVATSTRACLAELAAGGGLPRPGRDYWEIRDRQVSLGLAAPILVGVETAADLLEGAGPHPPGSEARTLARRARQQSSALRQRIETVFGAAGYPRYAPSRPGGVQAPVRDASVTFLLPPFRPGATPDPRLVQAWTAAQIELRRPAGGLAPGAGWRADGISWTPQTALFALTAAHLHRDDAASQWLDWLDRHRTDAGALPEKVLADGSPASVAPLAWSAALVVLTVAELEGRAE